MQKKPIKCYAKGYFLTHYHTVLRFTDSEKEAFKNNPGKGDNAGDQNCLLYPPHFYIVVNKQYHSERYVNFFCKFLKYTQSLPFG